MGDLGSRIKNLVLEAERVFSSPSIDAPRPKGVLIVGLTQRDPVTEELRKRDYFKENNIPIETANSPSLNHKGWYSIDLENYFGLPTHSNPSKR